MKFAGILNETGPTLNENAVHSFVVAKQISLWQLPQLHRCNWQLLVNSWDLTKFSCIHDLHLMLKTLVGVKSILCVIIPLNIPSKKHFGMPHFHYSNLNKLMFSHLNQLWNSRRICPYTIANAVIIVVTCATL